MKTKILATALSLSIMAGASTAFAATDAGQQIKDWFTHASNVAFGQVFTGFNGYWESVRASFSDGATVATNSLSDGIAQYGTDAANSTNSAVNAYADQYHDQIATAVAERLQNAPGEITAAGRYYIGQQNILLAQEFNTIKANATTSVNGAGTAAVAALDAAVNANTAEEVAALTDQINQAKTQLQALIDQSYAQMDTDMRANLDAKILAERQELAGLLSQLEANNKGAIDAEAQTLLASAQAQLDAVVAGINQ